MTHTTTQTTPTTPALPEAYYAQAGDLAQIVGVSHKHFILRLKPGERLQTHRGVLLHDDMIGTPWGTKIRSHMGKPFYLLQPALADLIIDTPRKTQVMYPKEIGFVLVTMGIGPGTKIIEAGTGSGGFTTALAFAVGKEGRIFSYEQREEMQQIAKDNLARLELDEQVTFKIRDIAEGFDETGVDALFLDLPKADEHIAQVRAALKPGGFFGCILPTTNQVSKMLQALEKHKFAFIEVCEIMLRYYKPVYHRLRPVDRMVAHTGFLVFARSILSPEK